MTKKIMTAFIFSLILALNLYSQKKLDTQAHVDPKDRQIIQLKLNPQSLQRSILEHAIIDYTNKEREKHHLHPCTFSKHLRSVARLHSKEMDSLQYFSHISPVQKNRELLQRIENAHITMVNKQVGENIGVDFYLAIATVPFYVKNKKGQKIYIDFKTKAEIPMQTYLEFARDMVTKWMASPGHKKNILTPEYTEIGIGVASGVFEGMDAIYVTQLFIGPLSVQKESFHNMNH